MSRDIKKTRIEISQLSAVNLHDLLRQMGNGDRLVLTVVDGQVSATKETFPDGKRKREHLDQSMFTGVGFSNTKNNWFTSPPGNGLKPYSGFGEERKSVKRIEKPLAAERDMLEFAIKFGEDVPVKVSDSGREYLRYEFDTFMVYCNNKNVPLYKIENGKKDKTFYPAKLENEK